MPSYAQFDIWQNAVGVTRQSVIQVVHQSLTSTVGVTANGTAVAVTGFNATITPTLATSRIWVLAQIMYSSAGTTYGGWFTRNGTAINLGDAGASQQRVSIGMALCTDTNQTNTFVYSYVDSPATTGSITYQFWVNNDNTNNIYLNRAQGDSNGATGKRGTSTITLLEVAG